jgi:hypothetical protein
MSGNNYLVFRLVVEVVPFSFLRVSHEYAFIRPRTEFARHQSLDVSLTALNLDKNPFKILSNHNLYGVFSTDLDGTRFNINVVVLSAFPRKSVIIQPYSSEKESCPTRSYSSPQKHHFIEASREE